MITTDAPPCPACGAIALSTSRPNVWRCPNHHVGRCPQQDFAGPSAALADVRGRVRGRHIPDEVTQWLMKQHALIVRVSGDVVCECGRTYNDHAEFMPTFHLLCDGRIGKT